MKIKKILFPFLALNIALSNIAYSETEQSDTTDTTQRKINYIEELSQKLWSDFSSALKNTKLKKTSNVPTANIAQGLSAGGSFGFESRPSVGGKYSGIDVWDMNISAYPEIFGLSNDLGLSASATRQITFIQQFEDRMSSLLRVPYDPITKLPIKSNLFFKTKFNKDTNQNEPVIKDGDFIGFRAPLTLSIGKGNNFKIGSHFSLDVSLQWIVSGEFDIRIFKMKNNQVRIKLMAIKDDTRAGSLGLNLMGFNGFGKMIISRLIDTNFIQAHYSESDSDLFIADYIFNLNQPESRDMYDQLIGHKMKIFDIKALGVQLKTANPFAKDATTQQHLFADLDRLNNASKEDQDKPSKDRRIIRVSSGENKTNSSAFGLKLNILKAIRASSGQTKSLSRATIYSQHDHNTNDKYILETQAKNFSYEWFWVWGEKDVVTTSLLLKSDDQFKPTKMLGFQISQTKEDMSMSLAEYNDIKNAFTEILPKSIAEVIHWPSWNFGEKKSVNNVYIQQELLFTDNLFKSNFEISEADIKNELILILKKYGKIRSKPMYLSNDTGNEDLRQDAYNKRDYVKAFSENFEQIVIPKYLSVVLNSNYNIADRYAAYDYLNKTVPLFSEINGALLLRLIPEKYLSEVIIGKLSMSARNQQPLDAYFPNKASYDKSNLFREITYQTQYILNRSFDLRHFMKEDGSFYSVEEILSQRTSK